MIKSISVKNFKGIKELGNLKLGSGATFVIGKNGAGKSTLISVIYLTSKIVLHRSANIVLDEFVPFGSEEFLSHNSRGMTAEFCFVIKEKKTLYRYSYSIGVSHNAFIIASEHLEEMQDENTIKELIFERTGDGIVTSGGKIPLHVNSDELVLSGYNEARTRVLADSFKNYKVLWFNGNNAESKFQIYNADSLNRESLDATAVRLYTQDKRAFDDATDVIKALIPNFVPPEIRKLSPKEEVSGDSRYVVFWRESWQDGSSLSYTLPGLSGGNIRLIELIFAIFSSKDSTCLIGEELENGQYLGRIKGIVEMIKTASIRRRLQMIFTTHSDDVLRLVAPSDVIYVEKTSDGYSVFKHLDELDGVERVGKMLGEDPTMADLLEMGVL